MNIKFDNGIYLALIVALLILSFFLWIKVKKNQVINKSFLLRALTLVLVILGLSNPFMDRVSNETETIFMLDKSFSARDNFEEYKELISDSLEYMDRRDSYGIVSFAGDTVIESTFKNKGEAVILEGKVESDSTDIQGALNRVYDLFDKDKNKRIVILSDGMDNEGNSTLKVPEDVELLRNKSDDYLSPEIQITSIEMPEEVRENEVFSIDVVVDSNIESSGELLLYSGVNPIHQRKIYVKKGSNRFSFQEKIAGTGVLEYSAKLNPKMDTIAENNRFGKIIEVEGKAKLLVIDGQSVENSIYDLIPKSSIDISKIAIQNLNPDIDNLSKYDAIIVEDVSKWEMTQEFMQSMDTYVKDLGKGLLVIGGKNSFSIGGYLDSDFEEILPVRSEAIRESKENSLDMIIVIDKSGSMMSGAESSMLLAKQAAAKVYLGLNPSDKLGVVVFDSMAYEVLGLGDSFDEEEVMMRIGGITASGGTNIKSGLEKAYQNLLESDGKSKHIILVTDGQSDSRGIDEIVSSCVSSNISISSIAIGSGADKNLLKGISDGGKGRFYSLSNAKDIPNVFLKEQEIMSKSYLNDRVIYPKAYYNSPGITYDDQIPLYGYISTSLKSASELILESDKDEPILSYWKYGLGEVFAWTSDFSGNWSRDIVSSQSGVLTAVEIVKYISENKYSDNSKVAFIQRAGDKGEIWIKNAEGLSHETFEYEIKDLDTLGNFKYMGDNKWKGEVSGLKKGIHYINIKGSLGTEYVKPFEVNYPNEYNVLKNKSILDKVDIVEDPGMIFEDIEKSVVSKYYLRSIILIIAIIIFLIDILLRTLGKNTKEKVLDKAYKVSEKTDKFVIETKKVKKENLKENQSTSSRLLEAKKKINK